MIDVCGRAVLRRGVVLWFEEGGVSEGWGEGGV